MSDLHSRACHLSTLKLLFLKPIRAGHCHLFNYPHAFPNASPTVQKQDSLLSQTHGSLLQLRVHTRVQLIMRFVTGKSHRIQLVRKIQEILHASFLLSLLLVQATNNMYLFQTRFVTGKWIGSGWTARSQRRRR